MSLIKLVYNIELTNLECGIMDYTIFLEPKDKRLGTFVNHFLFEDLAWCAAQRFHRTPRRVPGSPGSDRPEPPGGAFAA